MNLEADLSAAGRLHVQITPLGSGGVRDHAVLLQRTWGRTGSPGLLWYLDRDSALEQSLLARLKPLAERAPVSLLLHFSGYGYGKRGLCGWLVHELAEARQALGSRLKLVTYFHELFAGGPPWRSSFWLQPWQRQVAQQLLAQCDAAVTNASVHQDWIRVAARGNLPVLAMPVFSNVGEPQERSPASERPAEMVLFGAHATRARAAVRLHRCPQVLERLDIRRITEIGPGDATLSASLPLQLRHLGTVDAGELSAQLLQNRFAGLDYPVPYLAKSSVFAAYAAHGCVVLNTADLASSADGLVPGLHEHHLASALAGISDAQAQDRCAQALSNWYSPHALLHQARAQRALLDGCWPDL